MRDVRIIGCVGGQEKEWMRCFLTDLRAFGINAEQWMTAAQDEEEWRRMAEQGAKRIMAKWIAAEKVRAGPRHAVVCPNVTGRTKDRIAQNKRSCAGLLAVVDYIHMWRELVSSGRMSCCLSLFFFWSFFGLFFLSKLRPFVQSSLDMLALRRPHTVT